MKIIDVGKNSYEDLVYAYIVSRLNDLPVKSCQEWLLDCTNALEWCGSLDGFEDLVKGFEMHYLSFVMKIQPLIMKEIEANTSC